VVLYRTFVRTKILALFHIMHYRGIMAVATLIMAISALVVSLLMATGVFLAIQARPAAHLQPYDDSEIRSLLAAQGTQLATLTQAVANGIKEVDKNNRRIESVVRRARKELEDVGLEHPGLEAEAGDLQLSDEPGSPEQGVHPLHEVVGPSGDGSEHLPSGIPGATPAMEQELRARLGR